MKIKKKKTNRKVCTESRTLAHVIMIQGTHEH